MIDFIVYGAAIVTCWFACGAATVLIFGGGDFEQGQEALLAGPIGLAICIHFSLFGETKE